LDIYVVGDGESGELGLGPKSIDDKPPTGVTYPRRNKLLDAFGITQVAAGGMHCVALTAKNDIVTWGVNDNGALGRDTTWEAPTKDIDAGSDSDDSSDDGDLSPKESTPTIVSQIDLGKGAHTFVQVVAADSASFALTSTGSVFGWGSFRVSTFLILF
jgi:regulator of chromosome condensation